MSHLKTYFLLVIIYTLVAGCSAVPPKIEFKYQADADRTRIEDVHKIARLVEEFHSKTGHYPLAGGSYALPAEVMITKKNYKAPFKTIPLGEFVSEMSSGLGREVDIPLDPQRYDAWGGARMYQYRTDGQHYSVSAMLFFQTEYTMPLGQYSYKYQVSSLSIPQHGIFRFKDIESKDGGSKIDTALQTEFFRAVAAGDTAEADRLISAGAVLDPICEPQRVCSPVAVAIDNNDKGMIELLLDRGVDIERVVNNYSDDTPLTYAIVTGKADIAVQLVKSGADVDTCIHVDVSDPNSPCRTTPLMAAAENGQTEVLGLILQQGADAGVKDYLGRTALDYARENSNSEIEEILVNTGAGKKNQ